MLVTPGRSSRRKDSSHASHLPPRWVKVAEVPVTVNGQLAAVTILQMSGGGDYDDPHHSGAPEQAPRSAGSFPSQADDLLPNLARDAKGRIYPSDKIRIRPEQHPLKPGETYAPRHHGQHYHVEIRKDVTKSWNNKKNGIKVKPKDYKPGVRNRIPSRRGIPWGLTE